MTDNKARTSKKLCPNLHKSKLGAGIKDSSRTASQSEARELRELEDLDKWDGKKYITYLEMKKALTQARQEAREILQKEFDVKSEQFRKEVRKECIEELKKIGLNRIGFNRLVGFPRSELYEQFLREGLVRHEYEGILIPDTHHNHADEITELGHSKFPEIMDYNKDHTI